MRHPHIGRSAAVASILVSLCSAVWASELKVGVCSDVHKGFLIVLRSEAQIRVRLLEKLSAESLNKIDVVTWPMGRLSSNERERRLLREYVEAGGGLVLTRDPAYAFRDAMREKPPFPEVAGIMSRTWRYDRTMLRRVADSDHPLGKALPRQLSMAPYDHLILDPGPAGTILMLSEDADTVMVAGNLGKGHVVVMGHLPGCRKYSEKMTLLPEERSLLTRCVKWVGRSQ